MRDPMRDPMRDSTGVTSSFEQDHRVANQQNHQHANGSVSSSPSPLPTEKSGHLHPDPERTGAEVDFSHIDGKKVLRKMDLRLIPMLSILYLLAFLDRGNIGNAKIEHMVQDLKMTGPQYNWVLTVFFFTYCVFEVPSNLCLKRFRPSIWLPAIMVAWGVVMTLMGIVQDFKGLLIARLFLGVAEAGLYPGVAYYMIDLTRKPTAG